MAPEDPKDLDPFSYANRGAPLIRWGRGLLDWYIFREAEIYGTRELVTRFCLNDTYDVTLAKV